MVAAGDPVKLDEVAPRIAAPHMLSEYHWYENAGVPPDTCDVKAMDCPLSMVGLGGVIAPAMIAELTVTVSPGEQRETGKKAASVTLYE